MRLSVLYFAVAARRAAEAEGDPEEDDSRRIAGTFARLAAFSHDEEEAQIAALAVRNRRKAGRQRRRS